MGGRRGRRRGRKSVKSETVERAAKHRGTRVSKKKKTKKNGGSRDRGILQDAAGAPLIAGLAALLKPDANGP